MAALGGHRPGRALPNHAPNEHLPVYRHELQLREDRSEL